MVRNWTMRDLWFLMDREMCHIEVMSYLDGRIIARPKHNPGDKAWKWDGETWVIATEDDLKPSLPDGWPCYGEKSWIRD